MKEREDEVKQKFDRIQEILDTLQGKEASFMFIGHEGNRFVMGGNIVDIEAQILFAMTRYPVVRDIIITCSTHFGQLEKMYGERIRSIKMDHVIEVNSGNEKR